MELTLDEVTAMGVGQRCETCAVDWPITDDFEICPDCQQPTEASAGLEPMDIETAQSLKRHFDFERYYDNEWPALRQDS